MASVSVFRKGRRMAGTSLLAIATLTVTGLAGASSHTAVHAAIRAAGPMATTAAHTRAAATGASDITDLGSGGWRVESSATATQSGAQISSPGFDASSWLAVANDDAGAPGTEVEALLQNGKCPDDASLAPVNQDTSGTSSVFYGNNMQLCYGYESSIGKDTDSLFDVPWWWRTTFTASPSGATYETLIVNGVVGTANVWLNGSQVATSATVTGAYTRFTFPITSHVVAGTNAVAIEVQPNNPQKMFTVDDVDWNQIPPDNNTGIQFPVQLAVDGPLSDGNAHVTQSDNAALTSAALTVDTSITNHAGSSQAGTVTATITPPGGGTPVTVSKSITVAAGATDVVTFTPANYPSLTLAGPKLWWPYQMGPQPLYTLATSVSQNGTVSDSTTQTFGIRTVTSYLTGSSPAEKNGTRAFKINNVPLVIRGGGWSPNIFLHYSASDTAGQIALMKSMGVNAIRLEGHIMPDDWFQQMDAAGILVNGGFQCCDAWDVLSNNMQNSADQAIMKNSALTIGENLRDDPSVFSFQWSDDQPTGVQEKLTAEGFAEAGFDVPLISSAEYNPGPNLGASGEKEGPYNWVPPDYWYDTTHHDTNDSTQTNAGGAWGYDSEESAGDTVPTMYSLDRFMTPTELAELWESGGTKYNQYHTDYEPRCSTGYDFGTLCEFDSALDAQYGTPTSLAQYVEDAQAQEYQDTQAQFEAYVNNASNTPLPSTGTIYWQMDKGWPSLLWNLYNFDGDQSGAYFGTQEANRSLHAIYALSNGTVTLDNLTGLTQSGLSVTAKVYNLAGALTNSQTASSITLASQQVRNDVLTPVVPAATTPPTKAQVYFVELTLSQGGNVLDRNVYWLSTQANQVNWSQTLDQPAATMTQYANLQALRTLPTATVSVAATTAKQPGPDGADLATTVKVTNTSSGTTPDFLVRADLVRGTASGGVLPGDPELASSVWDANDITLWPGESQTLTVTYDSSDLATATPVVNVSGWNVGTLDVAAPVP